MILSWEVTVLQITLPEAVKQILLSSQFIPQPNLLLALEYQVMAALISLTVLLVPGLFGKEFQHNKAPGISFKW